MTIEEYIQFLEEKIEEGYDPEDDEALLMQKEASMLAFDTIGIPDNEVLEKLRSML